MTKLASRTCEPCRSGAPALGTDEIEALRVQIDPAWEVVENHHLRRLFRFRDFREALDYTNRVGEMAEEQGHHPDLYLAWGAVRVEVWTHKIDGLHEADFIFAAKCDALLESQEA
jgi:4a-hydroxytetrahydrobiopterin dehydratase